MPQLMNIRMIFPEQAPQPFQIALEISPPLGLVVICPAAKNNSLVAALLEHGQSIGVIVESHC